MSACRFIDDLLPRAGEAGAGDTEALLEHLEGCGACDERLRAGGDDLERLLARLSGGSSDEEGDELDRVLEADARREESIRSAVADVLIPTLSGEAQEIAKQFDPLQLYRAIDAVSVRIYTEIGLGERRPVLVTLASSGDVFLDADDEPVVPATEMASEIVSFAALWRFTEDGKHERVALWDQALALTWWMPLALADQPDLLAHFRRHSIGLWPAVLRRRFADRIPLFPLKAEERIKDAALRWMPTAAEEPLFLVQDDPGRRGGFLIGALTEGYFGAVGEALWLRDDAYVVRAEPGLHRLIGARGGAVRLHRFSPTVEPVRAVEVQGVRLLEAKMEVFTDDSSTVVRARRIGTGLGAVVAGAPALKGKA
jgi:hypothetical protein